MQRVLSVIVNYNGGALVEEAVASLVDQRPAVDVLVLDNDSRDGSADAVESRFPTAIVRRTGSNLGAVAQNLLLEYPEYDYYFIFNPDAYAEPDAIAKLVDIMDRRSSLALLGATLVEWSEPTRVQSFARTIDVLAFPFDAYEGRNVDDLPDLEVIPCFYATSAAVLVRTEDFKAVGGLDPSFFMFTDETDLAWRLLLRGRGVAVTPRVRVRHVGGATAPVGTKDGAYRTSLFRIYLRERNCAAMCLKCYSFPMLVLYIPLFLIELSVEALVLALMGRPEFAQTYARALRDLWSGRDGLMRRRREVQTSRLVGDDAILGRMYRGFAKLAALRARGIPRLNDAKRSASSRL